jgi:phage terminase large subunit-like protein
VPIATCRLISGYLRLSAIVSEVFDIFFRRLERVSRSFVWRATGSRRQPLLFVISTEGDSNEGIFPEQTDYGKAVLEGTHEDDSYFAIVYTIDKEDDWTQPEAWRKANPNLGVSVFEEDLEIRCKQAIANADSQASFLTKRLNVRVGASAAYFNMLAWSTICRDPDLRIEHFQGQPCMITLDLASKRDLTAKIVFFSVELITTSLANTISRPKRLNRASPTTTSTVAGRGTDF